MSRPLPIVTLPPVKAEIIAKILADRDTPYAVYDFIRYNLGPAAALVAVLTGEYRQHSSKADGGCSCS